jgi:hypothetical protein
MAQSDGQRGHTTESSTIISLGELMQMEQHRIDEEKQRKEKLRRDHESALRAARTRRQRELEEEKKVAEGARRAREQAEMEEAAALAGKILGFITRAKVQAEQEATALTRQQEHQRATELERAKIDARVGLFRSALVAVSLAALVTVGGLVGSYAAVIAPDHHRELTALQVDVAAGNEKAGNLERQLNHEREGVKAANQERAALAGKLASATQQIDTLRKQLASAPRGRPGSVGTPRPPVTDETTTTVPCPLGDPMCGLNGR